jgi:hypothetical protein
VELFEQIRREYEFGIGTIAGVAKKLNVHRRMVREAVGSALPKPRKKAQRRHWKMDAAVTFVDQILEEDKKAPKPLSQASFMSSSGMRGDKRRTYRFRRARRSSEPRYAFIPVLQ